MISPWRLTTARLLMTPVASADLPDLAALKADPRAFAQMLGGVRARQQVAEELARDIQDWGRYGFGMWSVRARAGGAFLGLIGLMHRPDGRGVALRFALFPSARGAGLAMEGASAALHYGHDQAGLSRIIAVAREDNFASRTVLGAIGMTETSRFLRAGVELIICESVRYQNAG
jgi:RimJ/RimL family protein N-acetyltransferase